ncbi:hypothetical protein IC617_18700 [Neiella sp. HB171785]|uniref:Uncharacterized protein n=1 Tax=Neiella litorisoli TaxID=2771431 RepID=A0A8J6QVU3_9GAMM|nr:hypothetical protein [Neiella litorisoli]MBD1391459.1 hypothetical protein [Neiella litorisoli]
MSVTKADVFLSDMAYKERLSMPPELRPDVEQPPCWVEIATSLEVVPDERSSSMPDDEEDWDDFERWALE